MVSRVSGIANAQFRMPAQVKRLFQLGGIDAVQVKGELGFMTKHG